MSAAEVINLIRTLSEEDRLEVLRAVTEMKSEVPATTVRYLDTAKAERIAEQIFTEHEELFRKLAQ